MPDLLVRSFAPFLLAFESCFTRPSFSSFWALTCAWLLCSGRRSLTRIIQSAQLTEFKHYCSFHRFFSQARWNLDDLGRCVFQLLRVDQRAGARDLPSSLRWKGPQPPSLRTAARFVRHLPARAHSRTQNRHSPATRPMPVYPRYARAHHRAERPSRCPVARAKTQIRRWWSRAPETRDAADNARNQGP